MFSQRRSHYWSQQSRTYSTSCWIVVLLHNSVCYCFALLHFITTKSQRKKKSLQRYRAKRIKGQLYGKYDKCSHPKMTGQNERQDESLTRSSPRSCRTLSVDRPLLWALKTWGKIDSSKEPKQQLYVFLEKVIFLWKLLSFTVVKSLVTNGSRLIARCFGFTFRSWLCWFYEFKV